MDRHTRREFLHSAAALLALGPVALAEEPASAVAPHCGPGKILGYAKWSAESNWWPIYERYHSQLAGRVPYAVVACYADQAA